MAVTPSKPPKNPPPKNTGCVLFAALLALSASLSAFWGF